MRSTLRVQKIEPASGWTRAAQIREDAARQPSSSRNSPFHLLSSPGGNARGESGGSRLLGSSSAGAQAGTSAKPCLMTDVVGAKLRSGQNSQRDLNLTRKGGIAVKTQVSLYVMLSSLCASSVWSAETPHRLSFQPDELVVALKEGVLAKSPQAVETKVIGAARLAGEDSTYIEMAGPDCEKWTSIPIRQVAVAHTVAARAVRCEGGNYPVLSVTLAGSDDSREVPPGASGVPVVTYLRVSPFQRVPRLAVGGAISDSDWDDCLDRYLDCQIDDCNATGGGVFGSLDSCMDHCDAVFEACTWDPF